MDNQLSIALGRNKLLKNVDTTKIDFRDIKGKLITIGEGEILFREGDSADSIYLVISGEINVLKKRLLGKAKSYIFNENDFFGQEEYFEETSRFSTAVALRDSYLIALSYDEIESLISQSQAIFETLKRPPAEMEELLSKATREDFEGPAAQQVKDELTDEHESEPEEFFKTIADSSRIKDAALVQPEEIEEEFDSTKTFGKEPATQTAEISETNEIEGELVEPGEEEKPLPLKDEPESKNGFEFNDNLFLNEDGIPKAEVDLTQFDGSIFKEEQPKTLEPSSTEEEFRPQQEEPPLRKTKVDDLDDALFQILSGSTETAFVPEPEKIPDDMEKLDEAFFAGLSLEEPEKGKEAEEEIAPSEEFKLNDLTAAFDSSQFDFPEKKDEIEKEVKESAGSEFQTCIKPEPKIAGQEKITPPPTTNDFEAEEIRSLADQNIMQKSKPKEAEAIPVSSAGERTMNADHLQMIIKAAELVNSNLKIDELLKNIVSVATNLTGADRGTLYLIDKEKGELWSLVAMGSETKEIRLKIGEGLSGYVAKTGEILNIKNAQQDPRFKPDFDKASGYFTKTVLTFPLKNNKGEIIGVLQLLNSAKGEFSRFDEELINAMSIHSALAIQNAEMVEKLLHAERVQSLGKMANFLIQDIKKPILVSKRYAEHLRSKNLPPDTIQLVDMLLDQLGHVADIVQTTSSYSEGKTILRTLNVSLNNTLTDYSSRIGAYVESRNCQLNNEFDKDVTVKLDMKEFYQCYMHIVKNACDAMPDGGRITIQTKRDDKARLVRIFFRDNGLGIPDTFKDKIFEPFMSHGKKEGTGLGLSITKKIVEAHSGTIDVESVLGAGATFIVALPTVSTL